MNIRYIALKDIKKGQLVTGVLWSTMSGTECWVEPIDPSNGKAIGLGLALGDYQKGNEVEIIQKCAIESKRSWIGRFLCWIGLHEWEQTRELAVFDGFPAFYKPYETPKRHCIRCHIHMRWLPGFGGSEFGCWVKDEL